MIRRCRPAMGTLVAIAVCAGDRRREETIAAALFVELARLERMLSEFDPRSSLSAVNAAAGRDPVRVPGEVVVVLAAALRVAEASGGAFDPTWRPLADVWDFSAGTPHLPGRRAIAERLRLVGHRDVALDPSAGTVALRREGMRLGLGGVAKAFIAERAAALGMALGASGVLVDAGGDVVARGDAGDRPWTVAVRAPGRAGASLGSIELRDAAVATSGDYERSFVVRGRRYHHLLDPRTGYPARGTRSVTAVGRDAAEVDALATALFVLGARDGARLLARFPGIGAAWVPDVDARDGTMRSARA